MNDPLLSTRFVVRQSVRLAYHVAGEGLPVVLVQGLGLSGRVWLSLPSTLVDAGHRVVAPDNRGLGLSDAPPGLYSMAKLADDLAAVMDDAATGPALVVGLSMGGMIALNLAIRHPRLVRGLLLAATTCGLPFGRPIPLTSLTMLVGGCLTEAHTPALIWHPRTIAERPGLVEGFQRLVEDDQRRLQNVVGQLAAAASHAAGFHLRRITCPVEVVTGDSDRLIPPENSRILAQRIDESRLTIVSRGGHAFPIEHPQILPGLIRDLAMRSGLRPSQSMGA
jgi:3-oxoadipate enol-lactonase